MNECKKPERGSPQRIVSILDMLGKKLADEASSKIDELHKSMSNVSPKAADDAADYLRNLVAHYVTRKS